MTKHRAPIHPRKGIGSQAGYTAVELVTAIAVFMIGVTGIISMQRVTISSNQHAKNLGLASHIAESWLDELAAEANQWNATGDFNETVWLDGLEQAGNPWFKPDWSPARQLGAGFDALGSPVANENDAHYCTHVRLTWLSSEDQGAKSGNGLARAEVRVFWRRDGALTNAVAPNRVCQITPAEFVADNAGAELFHIVYLSTTVRQFAAQE